MKTLIRRICIALTAASALAVLILAAGFARVALS